jgi:serine O-acetyltransferase
MRTPGKFDHLHSSQYTTFLYYLANTPRRAGAERALCNKLFGLNKAASSLCLIVSGRACRPR